MSLLVDKDHLSDPLLVVAEVIAGKLIFSRVLTLTTMSSRLSCLKVCRLMVL